MTLQPRPTGQSLLVAMAEDAAGLQRIAENIGRVPEDQISVWLRAMLIEALADIARNIDERRMEVRRLERFHEETIADAAEDARMTAHRAMMQRATAGSDQEAALAREPVVGGLIAAQAGADVVSLASRRGQPRRERRAPADVEGNCGHQE